LEYSAFIIHVVYFSAIARVAVVRSKELSPTGSPHLEIYAPGARDTTIMADTIEMGSILAKGPGLSGLRSSSEANPANSDQEQDIGSALNSIGRPTQEMNVRSLFQDSQDSVIIADNFTTEKLRFPFHPRSINYTSCFMGGYSKVRKIYGITYLALTNLEFRSSGFAPALRNGGPSALVWGMILSISGTMALALSLAEMASICPIAGAQYHWTALFAPPKIQAFMTWMQGKYLFTPRYHNSIC